MLKEVALRGGCCCCDDDGGLLEDDEDVAGAREEDGVGSCSARWGDGWGDSLTSGIGFVGDRDGLTKEAHLKDGWR